MTRSRRARVALLASSLALIAAACYPPGGPPSDQPLPPGGRIIVNGRPGAVIQVEDVTRDLSRVVYSQYDVVIGDPSTVNAAYWHYDDDLKTISKLPVRYESFFTKVALFPGGRSVVFSSPDPALRSVPAGRDCLRDNGFFQPPSAMYCMELYRYDLDTASLQQLTGVDEPSTHHQTVGEVDSAGQSVGFTRSSGIAGTGATYHRLDLTTGAVTEVPRPTCCSWDRGSHLVEWEDSTMELTSTDAVTGEVTKLSADKAVYVEDHVDNGRFVVVSEYVTEAKNDYFLTDTDLRTRRRLLSPWIDDDASHYLVLQRNVAPSGDDRLVIAPTPAA